jgi:hypothetical protein
VAGKAYERTKNKQENKNGFRLRVQQGDGEYPAQKERCGGRNPNREKQIAHQQRNDQ